MTKGQRQRRILMQVQEGLCHYCREPMVLPEPYPSQKVQVSMPQLCTIEHLRDKYDPTRHEPANGERRRVGACRQCNQDRSRVRVEEFGPNAPQKRSPRGHVRRPPHVVRSPTEKILRRAFVKPRFKRKPIWWGSDHLYWGIGIGIALGYLLGRHVYG